MKHISIILLTTAAVIFGVSAYGVPTTYFYGTDGNDTLYHDKVGTMGQATNWKDYAYGYKGNDILITGKGNDRVWGGEGNDNIQGWDGNDLLYGEDGNDIMNGGNGNDHMTGGDGDDHMVGGNGDDDMWGEGGNDSMYGQGGDDYLHGGNGWNVVVQTLEDFEGDLPAGYTFEGPILDGGIGNDTIVFRLRQPINVRGGAGKDRFIVRGRVTQNHRVTVSDIGERASIVFDDLLEAEVTVSENNGALEFSVESHVFMSYTSPDIPGLSTMSVHDGLSPALDNYGLTLVFSD